MNKFHFICARLIFYECVLKILPVTECHIYPSNVLFITVIAFKSIGLLRNSYFKISSNKPPNLVCNIKFCNFILYLLHMILR